MKRKILILLVLLLLTGCKAKYNLQINFGGNFIETGSMYFNSNLLGKGDNSSNKNEFLHQMGEKYGFNWINKKISFDDGKYVGYNFYQRYSTASQYANRSPAVNAMFTGLLVEERDNYVKLYTGSYNNISNYHKINGDIPTIFEGVEITISLPYKVIENNASSVNKTTNTYTWKFKSTSPADAGIVLKYQTNELYTYNPAYLFQFVSPYVYIMVVLIIIVLIVISVIKTKARFRNKI